MSTPDTQREITAHQITDDNPVVIFATDAPGPCGANHEYEIHCGEANVQTLGFQKGGIAETGVNGLTNEALLAIVKDRLECFQAGPYPCDTNATALVSINRAIASLKSRTMERMARGVEGREVV